MAQKKRMAKVDVTFLANVKCLFFYTDCQGIGCQCTLGYGGYTVCAASWGTEAIHDMLTKHILTLPAHLTLMTLTKLFGIDMHE